MSAGRQKRAQRNEFDDSMGRVAGSSGTIGLDGLKKAIEEMGERNFNQERLEHFLTHKKKRLADECKPFVIKKFGREMDRKFFVITQRKTSSRGSRRSSRIAA